MGGGPAAGLLKSPAAGWCAGRPTVRPRAEASLGPSAASERPGDGPRKERNKTFWPSTEPFLDDSIAKTGGNPGRNTNQENGQTPEGTKIGRAAQTGRLWTIWSSSSHRAAQPGPVNDSRASPDRQAAGRPAAIGLASWLVALLQRAGRP